MCNVKVLRTIGYFVYVISPHFVPGYGWVWSMSSRVCGSTGWWAELRTSQNTHVIARK